MNGLTNVILPEELSDAVTQCCCMFDYDNYVIIKMVAE